MQLAKEEHKKMLLELIDRAAFPGSAAYEVAELRKEVETAIINATDKTPS